MYGPQNPCTPCGRGPIRLCPATRVSICLYLHPLSPCICWQNVLRTYEAAQLLVARSTLTQAQDQHLEASAKMVFRLRTTAMRPTRSYVTQRSNGVNHVRSAVAGHHHYSSGSPVISSDSQHQEQAALIAEEETLISGTGNIGNLFNRSAVSDGYVNGESQIFPRFLSREQGVGTESPADRHSGSSLLDMNSDTEAASTDSAPVPALAEATDKNHLYWQRVPLWHNVSEKQFMEKKWQVRRHISTRISSVETSLPFC